MANHDTFLLIQNYYNAFNERNVEKMASYVSDSIVHDLNQGLTEVGKPAFERFIKHMNETYHETIHDLVILTSRDGQHASAKFHISGNYLKTEEGLPPATGQPYIFKAGAFFEIEDKKITRITDYFNSNEKLNQLT